MKYRKTDGTFVDIAGFKGSDGKSAYESAVDGGWTKTEAQFNSDLADLSTKSYVDGLLTTVTPEMFGAVGDDVTDDTQAIRNFFIALQDGTQGELMPNKTYNIKCDNGVFITLKNKCNINGNGSTLHISSAIPSGSNTYSHIFWDGNYDGHITNSIDEMVWRDVKVHADFGKLSETVPIRTYLFYLCDIKNLLIDNCSFVYDGSEWNKSNIFSLWGTVKGSISNSYFKNSNAINEGGSIIWFQSRHEDTSKLKDGMRCDINNCTFDSDCADEILSLYNYGTHDIVVNNCKLNKTVKDMYYSKTDYSAVTKSNFFPPFLTVINKSTTLADTDGIYHKIIFNDCDISFVSDDDYKATFVAITEANVTPLVAKFNNCRIKAEKLYKISNFGKTSKIHDTLKDWHDHRIEFNKCTMDLVGNNTNVGMIASDSMNMAFDDCNINSNMDLMKCYYTDNAFVTNYRLEYLGCRCQIANNGTKLLTKQANDNLYIIVKDCEFFTDTTCDIYGTTTSYSRPSSVKIAHADDGRIVLKDNYLNGTAVSN